MKLLIVGAGAVGVPYGYLASRLGPAGGAEVTYFIKPKHRADLEKGIELYWWKGRKVEASTFTHFDFIESGEALRRRKFDAVLITLPSDKFRADGWLSSFLADFNLGSPEGKIWSLQPDDADRVFLEEKLGPAGVDRVVYGHIPIISYLAPMPGETFTKPGYAFYIPPGGKAGWSGKNEAAVREAVTLFENGGLPSKRAEDRPTSASLLPEALLRAVVAGLERSEWSMDRLVNGENIHLVSAGIREMTAITARTQKVADPGAKWWGKLASSPAGLKLVIRLARKIIPFDFEAYMRVHFTKVEGQMHLTLAGLIESGKKGGLSTTNLILLRGRTKPSSSGKSPTPAPTSPSQ